MTGPSSRCSWGMAHTNLRELLIEDRFLTAEELQAFEGCPQETAEREPGTVAFRRLSAYPSYEKDKEDPVCIVGEEGNNVLLLSRPKVTIVPLVEYDLEKDIQERISVLFCAAAVGDLLERTAERVTLQAFYNEARKAEDWYAVLAIYPTTKQLKNLPCRVYSAQVGNKVIAVREPKYAGRVVTDSKGRVGLLVMQSAVRRVVELTEE